MLRLYRKVIEPDFYTLTSKKQMKIDFQEKMIEFAEKEYSVDTKKIWFQTLLWYWEERSRLKIKMSLCIWS